MLTERRMDTLPPRITDRPAQGDHDFSVRAPQAEAQIDAWEQRAHARTAVVPRLYEPPVSALGPLFLFRLERIHSCRVGFVLDVNPRATANILGGYYKSRRLVRVYVHDCEEGRRSLAELFDTFLHEVAHHLEYTEPDSFGSSQCRRVPGQMHSDLFWSILGELRERWVTVQAQRRR
jgi:hypothetical protein